MILATPATIAALIASGAPNATVTLGPGTYPPFYLRGASAPTAPLTIDASDPQAVMQGVRCDGCANLTIRGATFRAAPGQAFAIAFAGGHDLTVTNVTCDGYQACVDAGGVQRATLSFIRVTGSTSDGIDLAGSQSVTIANLTCSGGTPAPGAHPDCLQMWAEPRYAPMPLADIVVDGVTVIGPTQGVDTFGNTLPIARLTVRNVTVASSMSQGVDIDPNCTGCSLANVRVQAEARSLAAGVQLHGEPTWPAGSVANVGPGMAGPK